MIGVNGLDGVVCALLCGAMSQNAKNIRFFFSDEYLDPCSAPGSS